MLVLNPPSCSPPTSSSEMSTSTGKPATNPSMENFTSIFHAATCEYKKLIKKDIHTHPFALQFHKCDSPSDVLDIFRTQSSAFEQYRKGDDRLMRWLDPTVNILSTFSTTFGEALALVVSLHRPSDSM
jgi:hypothetical protein